MTNEEKNQKVENIKKDIDSIINDVEILKNNSESEYFTAFSNLKKELESCKRRFDCQKYFVVCLGAVKAGKSTLLNALAEKDVSPSGAGVETTLRCSIIMVADEQHPAGVTLYRSDSNFQNENNSQYENAVRDLLEYFQGTLDWIDLQDRFSKETIPNGFEKLNYILTSSSLTELQNFKDFFLAEIRIDIEDENNILKKNVALIDLPGIDGVLAGVEANKYLEYLPGFCHHLMLVQSSVSALNQTTSKHLEKFVASNKTSPIYAICNEVRAKSEWKSKNSIDKELEELQNNIWRYLTVKSERQETFSVNAAMAWDYYNTEIDSQDIIKDKNELLDTSKIIYLKKALLKYVEEKKASTILHKALDKISCIKSDILGKYQDEFQERVDNEIKQIKDTEAIIKSVDYEFEKQTENSYLDINIKSPVRTTLEKLILDNNDGLDSMLTKIKKTDVEIKGYPTGAKTIPFDEQKKIINEFLLNIDTKIRNIVKKYEFDSKTTAQLQNKKENLKNALNQYIPDEELFCDFLKTSIETETESVFKYPTAEEYKNSANIYDVPCDSWFSKKGGTRNKKEIEKHCSNRLEDYKGSLCEKLENQLIENYAEKTVDLYKDSVESLKQKIMKKLQQEINSAEKSKDKYNKTVENANNIKEKISSLKKNIEKFQYEVK